jgi:thioredoxin reductase (NADPH)
MPEPVFDGDAAFPRLGAEVLAILDRAGRRRRLEPGEILFRSGDRSVDFFVVLSGRVAIVDGFGSAAERVLGVHGDGRFVGELTLVTGEAAYNTAVVREAGEAIVLSPDELKSVIAAHQSLGDLLLTAFIARRSLLIGLGSGLRLIGSPYSPDSRRLREFLTRNRIPHAFLDVEADTQAEQLLRELGIGPRETPLVLRGSLALRNPTNSQVARALNLSSPASSHHGVCDTVIVGAGPAGLGAAVYAASEGLSTALIDSVSIGGQAGTTARIENYLGFPAGISGSELAERAAIQAGRFGARSEISAKARRLAIEDGYHVVELDGGARLRGRTVVLATGASYRKLDVPRLPEFEGAGVYYAATEVEAQMCGAYPVAVAGGANSAGQAAVFLAGRVAHVHLIVRGGDLAAGMSRYLVDQIHASAAIDVHLNTEVRRLHGDVTLEAVTVDHTSAGTTGRLDARALFVFIGADPCTGWLDDAIATDEHGFVLTGQDLSLTHLDPAVAAGQRTPLPLETSRPGVFAVGDVRCGSIKRVASAVGEGAMAVRLIHQYLALRGGARP